MLTRRGIWVAMVVALTAVGLSPSTASAGGVGPGSDIQSLQIIEWRQPGTEPLDGIGQWVYVAPIPPAGAGQLSTKGYEYGPGFVHTGGGTGAIALSTDDQGPIAGIQLNSARSDVPSPRAIIRYPWSPGKFYFLFAAHAGNGLWKGWVHDYTTARWTTIGAVQATDGRGLLDPSSSTWVRGAQGQPDEPFSHDAVYGVVGVSGCDAFPRVDAYVTPPLGYRGRTVSTGEVVGTFSTTGTCKTTSRWVNGWLRHRLGTLPPG